MSKHRLNKSLSNLYDDLGPYPVPTMQIQIQTIPLPDNTLGDDPPRKAPSPPVMSTASSKTASTMTRKTSGLTRKTTQSSILSRNTSAGSKKSAILKEKEEMKKFRFDQGERDSPTSDEVALLLKRIQYLESRLDELDMTVRVLPQKSSFLLFGVAL